MTSSWSGWPGSCIGAGVCATSRSSSGRRSVPGTGEVEGRGPGSRVRVDDRELDLVLVGAEVHEQLVDLVDDLGRAGVAPVDLVDRDDDRQPARHRLLEHVAGLRQRALRGVDEEQHRVDHQQAALHLAAEVGVAGRVHDVQAHAAVLMPVCLAMIVMPFSRSRSIESITRSATTWLTRNDARLAQHRVDERRLAVVDVGDDGEVAQVVANLARGSVRRGRRSDRGRGCHGRS